MVSDSDNWPTPNNHAVPLFITGCYHRRGAAKVERTHVKLKKKQTVNIQEEKGEYFNSIPSNWVTRKIPTIFAVSRPDHLGSKLGHNIAKTYPFEVALRR
jgi:hypothetical protein